MEDSPPGVGEHELSRDDGEMLDNGERAQEDGHHNIIDLPLSPKRRRIYGMDETESALAKSVFRTSEALELHQSAHSTQTGEEAVKPRPAFLRPSMAPQDQPAEPLPEAFSPHRRGQKYVPGGMAATVQQWIVETGRTVVQSRQGHACSRRENVVIQFKVDIARGQGPFLVNARTLSGETANMLLIQSSTAAMQCRDFGSGSVICIRDPTWDVELDGQSWAVVADWELLP